MSPVTAKRTQPTGLMALVSAGILLTALAAHPQTVNSAGSGAGSSMSQSSPSGKAQSGESTSSGKSTPMGSAADASGNAGSNKAGAKASGSASSDAQGAKVSKADADFMKDIAYSNVSEIATAKLALANSQNDQVKTFAQKMIDDHTQAQKELEQLAQSKGVTLPNEPDTKHKAAAKALEKLKGDKFDAMYMKQAGENDHQKTHKLLDKVGKKAKDQDLKAYATKTIAAVDGHLKMANQIRDSAKGGKGGKADDKSASSADRAK